MGSNFINLLMTEPWRPPDFVIMLILPISSSCVGKILTHLFSVARRGGRDGEREREREREAYNMEPHRGPFLGSFCINGEP